MTSREAHERPDGRIAGSLDDLIHELAVANSAYRLGPITPEIAERLGAAHHCDVCDRTIVEVLPLVDELLARYDRKDESVRRTLADLQRRSPLETGDHLSPNYCRYHAQITSE